MDNEQIPVVILCGGSGTRLREQTEFLPKPMIPIGNKPMVVHIMKWYAKFGFRKFILALGYKQEIFKQYFANYNYINNDIQVNTKYGEISRPICCVDDWDVTLVDTGLDTLKGGRLKRVGKYIDNEMFMLTYGDGISDINLNELLQFHYSHNKMISITGVHHPYRFGDIKNRGDEVIGLSEKPPCLINGGFMMVNKDFLSSLSNDCDLEVGPFQRVIANQQMMVFQHSGFWACMDTLNDVLLLEKLWKEGNAPWKV